MQLQLIPNSEFQRIGDLKIERIKQLELIADMCRANTLVAVKNAGSGHLGSSFSSMEIFVWLYYVEMNIMQKGIEHPDRDIFFSSKGHDVPGLYSVLHSLGILSDSKLCCLRRLGGLDGHPDVNIPGIEANSGSLGMGISKGRGIAWAKTKLNHEGHVYVLTGDGEFQEGQNFEALQSCVHQKVNNITVIMDHNMVQSDRPVENIISLGNLIEKLTTFGWHVEQIDGNSFFDLERIFEKLKGIKDKPKFIIANTLKGNGVSFMEHPIALQMSNGLYPWHAGAPDDSTFKLALAEITGRLNRRFSEIDIEFLQWAEIEAIKQHSPVVEHLNALGEPISQAAPIIAISKTNSEYVVEAYGKALEKIAAKNDKLIVLDADLSSDCRLRYFENSYPDRFIENGIAEQDMVSMAGGLAKMGFLPVVNSFASFLASRANEQIYNNCTEKTKIIYGCHYAGLIPAGPGKSHQSIRDISLLGALPNMEIIQPCNATETEMVMDYCIHIASENCAIRMNISPSPRIINLPESYNLTFGQGVSVANGTDAVLIAYGPVMLNEALIAGELLIEKGFGLEVVNMPWLNRLDIDWWISKLSAYHKIFVLEDHAPVGGLGDFMLREFSSSSLLKGKKFNVFSIEGFPACGTPTEALRYHGLDGGSVANRILKH